MSASSMQIGAQRCFFPVSITPCLHSKGNTVGCCSASYILVTPRTLVLKSHSSHTATGTASARSSNMSSATVNNTTAQSTADRYPDILTTTSEAKEDHPLSARLNWEIPRILRQPSLNGTATLWTGNHGRLVALGHSYLSTEWRR